MNFNLLFSWLCYAVYGINYIFKVGKEKNTVVTIDSRFVLMVLFHVCPSAQTRQVIYSHAALHVLCSLSIPFSVMSDVVQQN